MNTQSPLRHVETVLVRAQGAGNIGQIARAMKNFGVSRLKLVNCTVHKVDEAYNFGWKAKDILDRARTFHSLQKALRGAALTVGFTRRTGRYRGAPRSLQQIVPQILEVMRREKVALVFGNERNGLSNEELAKCHEIAMIPTRPEYASLNLSHAVATSLFAIYSQTKEVPLAFKKAARHYATQKEFKILMNDFWNMFGRLGYDKILRLNVRAQTQENIERFFRRSGLEKREYHLFRAFLARVRQKT